MISTALILAIRTAKRPIVAHDVGLNEEIGYRAGLTGMVVRYLVLTQPELFPNVDQAWRVPEDGESPK